MGAVTSLSIADGLAVTRTFVPTREGSDGFVYLDKLSGITVGYNKISALSKLPSVSSTGEKNFRIKIGVHVPITEVLPDNPGLSRLAYTLRFNGEFVVPERSTLNDRKHLRAFVKNAMAHSIMTDLVESLDSQY